MSMHPTRTTLLIAAAALFVSTGAPGARAGDFATLETIGFSADGKVFAFEQYGIQDGSGFPYAEIVFVDLDADDFISPSPIRIRIEEDGADIAGARAEARSKAEPLFAAHAPEQRPGFVAADNPPTELTADPHRVAFLPRALRPTPDMPTELRLDILQLPEGANCAGVGRDGTVAGFRLTLIGLEADETASVLHEDASVPASRNCPLDYRLSRIVVADGPDGPLRAVALIGVESIGFEGPDMRYIAVPVPLR